MGKLFKDELLKDFSYTGKKGKKKFSTLAICSVVFGELNYIINNILQIFNNNVNLYCYILSKKKCLKCLELAVLNHYPSYVYPCGTHVLAIEGGLRSYSCYSYIDV